MYNQNLETAQQIKSRMVLENKVANYHITTVTTKMLEKN